MGCGESRNKSEISIADFWTGEGDDKTGKIYWVNKANISSVWEKKYPDFELTADELKGLVDNAVFNGVGQSKCNEKMHDPSEKFDAFKKEFQKLGDQKTDDHKKKEAEKKKAKEEQNKKEALQKKQEEEKAALTKKHADESKKI